MNDEDIIRLMGEHFAKLFPRDCPNCGRHYASLKQYILETERIGNAVSYDAELGRWEPDRPIGGVVLANCPCGSTMALSTEGLPVADIHRILEWIRAQTGSRGISAGELLDRLRDEVRRRVLQDETE